MDGEKFDFKGEDGMVYNLLSTNNLTVNGRIIHDTFHSLVPGGTSKKVLVHGSFFTEMYLNMAIGTNHSVQVMCKAGREMATKIAVAGQLVSLDINTALGVKDDGSFFLMSDIKTGKMPRLMVKMTQVEVEGEWQVQVTNKAWQIDAKSKYYPLREKNGNKQRLDISFAPKTPKLLGKVAPHGLIGQTFDFDQIAVDGARDNYDDEVVTTKAMGEGAIEGAGKDYEVPPSDPYSAAFKYSRWNLAEAAPRDISKLSGLKRPAAGGDKQAPMAIEL